MLDCCIPIEEFDRDLMTDLKEMFEQFHQEVEIIAIELEEKPNKIALVKALSFLFEGIALNAAQINLEAHAECLSESSRAMKRIYELGVYPKRMSELLLLINDRIFLLVKDVVFDHALDYRKVQPVLVALQFIVLSNDVQSLETSVSRAVFVMLEELYPTELCANKDDIVLFEQPGESAPQGETDSSIELFGDDDNQKQASSPCKNTLKQSSLPGLPENVYILKHHNNPVLIAKEFIAKEIEGSPIKLISQVSDSASNHKGSHSDFLMELSLACNFLANSPIDPLQLALAIACHDIGLTKYRDLLNKPGALNVEERQIIMAHPLEGADIASAINSNEDVTLTILHHHERVNGSGYPLGLKDKDIHTGGKLLAIVDSFHAMVDDRPYRRFKKDWQRALMEINSSTKTLYDPQWVKLFGLCLVRYWSNDNR